MFRNIGPDSLNDFEQNSFFSMKIQNFYPRQQTAIERGKGSLTFGLEAFR
jgi:hypothetical protein